MLSGKGRGGGGGPGERSAVQVGPFLVWQVTMLVMPGPGVWEQPALPGSAGRGCCPGDKMIDWVSPACGDAAAQSNQAARLAIVARNGRQRLTAARQELAAVVPIG